MFDFLEVCLELHFLLHFQQCLYSNRNNLCNIKATKRCVHCVMGFCHSLHLFTLALCKVLVLNQILQTRYNTNSPFLFLSFTRSSFAQVEIPSHTPEVDWCCDPLEVSSLFLLRQRNALYQLWLCLHVMVWKLFICIFSLLLSKIRVYSAQDQPKLARVKACLGRTGSRGGVAQVRVEFLDDPSRFVFLLLGYYLN